jgi:KDO2-lipid IV(A) lauroyltransferase
MEHDNASERAAGCDEPAPVPQDAHIWWIRALSHLPWSVIYALSTFLLGVMRHVLRYRVRVAQENLRRCFPSCSEAQIDRLLAQNYRHLAQVVAEFFKTASMSAEELRSRVTLVNLDKVHAETRAGRSVLLLGAHQCNWEWSLHAVALQVGAPMEAAYKPLHAAGADRELRKMRSRFGARLIVAKRLLREIARRRNMVRAVALIADQVPATSDGRLWLNFLGCDTAFYPGPGEIARCTGYAAFFAAMSRTRRGHYQIDFQPICAAGECLESEAFTARYARLLEQLIREHPADWTWTHRRWKIACPYQLSTAQVAPQ